MNGEMAMRISWALGMVLAALLAVTAARGEDWPQFRGLNRDGKSPETGLLQEWPAEGPKLLWSVNGLGAGFSSVAVADGMVYATGFVSDTKEGRLSAFDMEGKLLWQTNYGAEFDDESYAGTRSTPTLDGGRLYEWTGKGAMLCFDAKTGGGLWSRDLAKDYAGVSPRCGYAEAPLIHKETVICTPGGKDAALVAMDKHTGATVWTSTGFSDFPAYCSPILLKRGEFNLLVTITARNVDGLDADSGKLVWSLAFDSTAEDPNHSVAPACGDDWLYITSGHRDGGQMYKLSPEAGTLTRSWTDTTLNTLHGGLISLDGYIYGSSSRGKWVCLEAKSGQVMYETTGVGMGSVAFADGMFYCYGEKGTLGLVRATPTAHEVISKFKIEQGEGPHWAHPVISGKRLYIRHGDALMVYAIGQGE
jgi:outer membrane protein assembly factor BamB